MLTAMFGYRVKTNEEFRKKAERQMEEITALHKQARENCLQTMIDSILQAKQEGWWEEVSELIQKEENQNIINLNDKLKWFKKVYELGGEEQRLGRIPTLCKFSTLDEMQEVYQKTVFCLRRMELGMVEDECRNFLELLKAWELPVEYLLMVLKPKAIYSVQNVVNRLTAILIENGYVDYSKRLLRYLENTTR